MSYSVSSIDSIGFDGAGHPSRDGAARAARSWNPRNSGNAPSAARATSSA
jgi:hypothetical protein